jgi:hypothetical protein
LRNSLLRKTFWFSPVCDSVLVLILELLVSLHCLWKVASLPHTTVFATIQDIASDKAPGRDGFIGTFFKKSWLVINFDFMQDLPPRLGREGRGSTTTACGAQPSVVASGAAGRGSNGRLSSDTASPPPLGHPSRRPRSKMCIIPRTVEIAANEITLERALVVMVAGTRPELTPSDV